MAMWLDDLLLNRTIDIPDEQALTTATLEMVRERLVALTLSSPVDDETLLPEFDTTAAFVQASNIAILEVDTKWYLGLSRRLDDALAQVVTPSRTIIRYYAVRFSHHAEPNALNKYFNSADVRTAAEGKMVITSQPCNSCIREALPPYPGLIRNGAIATQMNRLLLYFNNSNKYSIPVEILT